MGTMTGFAAAMLLGFVTLFLTLVISVPRPCNRHAFRDLFVRDRFADTPEPRSKAAYGWERRRVGLTNSTVPWKSHDPKNPGLAHHSGAGDGKAHIIWLTNIISWKAMSPSAIPGTSTPVWVTWMKRAAAASANSTQSPASTSGGRGVHQNYPYQAGDRVVLNRLWLRRSGSSGGYADEPCQRRLAYQTPRQYFDGAKPWRLGPPAIPPCFACWH